MGSENQISAGGVRQITALHELSHINAVGLKLGQKGKEVEDLQRYLLALGYLQLQDGVSSGLFDAATESALALFQRFYNLTESRTLDAATARMMAVRRGCGVPDVLPSGFPRKNPWPKNNLQFAFANIPSNSPDMNSVQKAADAFRQGYALWEAVTPIKFSWSANAADVTIEFERSVVPCGRPNPDGSYNYYDACTDFGYEGITHAKSRFRGGVIWKVVIKPHENAYDMVAFAAHEVGHALGLYFLDGLPDTGTPHSSPGRPNRTRLYSHSRHKDALMYPQIPANRRKLDPDDIAAAKRVYG